LEGRESVNISVNSQVLATELRLLNKVVPTKPAIAALSHAIFRADEDLSFYATDLELALASRCPAAVRFPGAVVLPVARFLSMVEQFPDADVNIEQAGSQVVVRCGAFTTRMSTLSIADFPKQEAPSGEVHTLDAAALVQMITRTRYAISATSAKHVLQGALLKLTEAGAVMVATDGKRLALATAAHAGIAEEVIVPMKALDVIEGQSGFGQLELRVGKNHLFFTINGRTLTSRTFAGKFPKYDGIIPKDNTKVVTADRQGLTAALRRVTLAAEENNAVNVTIESGTLSLFSQSSGLGSADEGMVVAYDGPPLKVCVNGNYMLDFLNVAGERDVVIRFKDAKSAMRIEDTDAHVGVIMLMRS
jgi:DNA polymerase-3 subunit beta